jgi:flagellar basal-body rod modification protein FlgD
MSVSAMSSATSGTSGATQVTPQDSVTKDEFLKLFVTQLKYQDPLNPMDSTEFTSQLAQFSSLEQLTDINTGVGSLLQSQGSLQNALVTGLIGRQVGFQAQGDDGSSALQYGTVTGVTFDSGTTHLIVDGTTQIALGDIQAIQ